MGKEDLVYIFQLIDYDNSGAITKSEFLNFLGTKQYRDNQKVQDFLFLLKGYSQLSLK